MLTDQLRCLVVVVVLRARFLRRLQIEDDDDHEHDQAIRASSPSRREATLRILGRDFDVILGRNVLRKKDIFLTIPNVTMEQHLQRRG